MSPDERRKNERVEPLRVSRSGSRHYLPALEGAGDFSWGRPYFRGLLMSPSEGMRFMCR